MARSDRPIPGLRLAETRAARLLRDRGRLTKLARDAERRVAGRDGGELDDVVEEVQAFTRLARAYASGRYREVSPGSMVLVVAALLYLVSPLDLIPDFLPGGLSDDAAIVAFVLRRVRGEIDEFLAWERTQPVFTVSRPALPRPRRRKLGR